MTENLYAMMTLAEDKAHLSDTLKSKRMRDYRRNRKTEAFFSELAKRWGVTEECLWKHEKTGIWCVTPVITHFGSWISPRINVFCNLIVAKILQEPRMYNDQSTWEVNMK